MVSMRTHEEVEKMMQVIGKKTANGYHDAQLKELDKLMKLFEDMEYTVRTRLEPLEPMNPNVNDPLTKGRIDALKWFLNRED